jgi:hypothetical protein
MYGVCMGAGHRHSHELSISLRGSQHGAPKIKEFPVGNRAEAFEESRQPLVRKAAKYYVVLKDQDGLRISRRGAPYAFKVAQPTALARVWMGDAGNPLDSIGYSDGVELAKSFLPALGSTIEIDAINQIEELKWVTRRLPPTSEVISIDFRPRREDSSFRRLTIQVETSAGGNRDVKSVQDVFERRFVVETLPATPR